MKFQIDRKSLQEAVNQSSRAIAPASPLPSLTGLKIEAKDNHLTLTGSDSNVTIISHIYPGELTKLNVEDEGTILIEAKYLQEIVRKLDCEMLTIESYDESSNQILSDNGTFNLNGISIEKYPVLDLSQPETVVEIPGLILKDCINQTIFACSDKDTRPVLSGVNFNFENEKLYCSATDSYRLSQKTAEVNHDLNTSITIPAKALNEVLKSLSDDNGLVTLRFNNKKAQFIFDKTMIQTTLIDGKFPDVSRIIPKSYKTSLKINAKEIYNAIDRTSFIKSEKKHIARLECSPMEIRIKTNSADIGSSDEAINDAIYEGEPLTLSVNGNYLIDAIKAVRAETLILEFTGTLSPFIVKNMEDDSILEVVVPIKSFY